MRDAFKSVGMITILAVYFLILVGGTVRASGAGMGCPDWPKCFGRWIPPTDVSQLPANYQEIYADRGYASEEFNVVKTWTEYINRVIGVGIGFLIFLTLVCAFGYRTDDPTILWLSLAAFVLVGFQGWLGSVVVSTNLLPGMVTVHMLVALVIVGLLIWARARAQAPMPKGLDAAQSPYLGGLLIACLALSLLQIGLGTQVREAIDVVSSELGSDRRSEWVESTGVSVLIHRSLSIVILFTNGAALWMVRRFAGANGPIVHAAYGVMVCIVAEAVVGIVLFYASVPAVLQPVHLLLGAVMFGLQFYVWITYRQLTRGTHWKNEIKAANA